MRTLKGGSRVTTEHSHYPVISLIDTHRTEPRISVVIPAKNEARNLPHVFAGSPTGLHEVILVDGDSRTARSRSPAPPSGHHRRRPDPQGEGQRPGLRVRRGHRRLIVMLDADGSTDPAEIPRFVKALREGADFAKGSRFMPGAGSSDISRLRQCGNFWLNKIVNLLYGTRYTDLCYGYNAFRRECLAVMDLDAGAEAAPGRRDALGGRLRGGDPDQRADRQGRAPCRRGPELRATGYSAPATSTPSPTASASSTHDPRRADPEDGPYGSPGGAGARRLAGVSWAGTSDVDEEAS